VADAASGLFRSFRNYVENSQLVKDTPPISEIIRGKG
jgi:hypothetical protein